jgi:cellulose synthase operon protein C
VRTLLLSLMIAIGCRTAGPPVASRYPALGPAHSPEEARSIAAKTADPLAGAQIAWLMGNDRKLAREQIARGLGTPAPQAPLRLLRALIALAELDRTAALDDLLSIIETAPQSGEAEIAMVVLYDWLTESAAHAARIRTSLDRSGLLGDQSAPAAHVALASAIALRLDLENPERVKKNLARGGWLTTFTSFGPLAPVNDVFFTQAPETFRGFVPPKRILKPVGRRLPVSAGDAPGVYRLNGCFELAAEHAGQPLAIEAHLPAPAKLSIDGVPILSRTMTLERESSLIRKVVRATAGWHCAEMIVRAYQNTKPSVSLLAADGRPVIANQELEAQQTGSIEVVEAPASVAMKSIRELTYDPDRALLGRLLGALIALSYWIDDVELARELMDGTDVAAPKSAVVHVSNARLMMWSGMPDRIAQATLRQALELDPSHPSVLLALAHIVWKDDPEAGEELIERAERAAPSAAGPYELAFRLAKQRGWNAEAAKNLQAALSRDPGDRLLLEGAQFYRGIERVADAVALEKRAEELRTRDREVTIASHALARGDLDAAVAAYVAAAKTSDDANDQLTRAAEIELGRGRPDAAIAIAQRAVEIDPLTAGALKVLLRAHLVKKDAKSAHAVLVRLQELGESTLRMETGLAALEGRDLEELESDPWLKKALAFELAPLIEFVSGTKTPRGLDPGDRWSSFKSVTLLDRVVDVVRPDGRALSLRHSVTRLQTKEATDAAGEINVPADALTLALRTLKPDGRRLEVDRHSGKEDLSFSGLAPGDAVERKWLTIDDPATPWGGYLRRFYFKNTTPIVRGDLAVVVPKGTKLWSQSYNGAPLPTVHELADRTIYLWQEHDVEPFEPEPYAVPYEEYVPFVVVAVGVDDALAHRSNVLGLAEAARSSLAVRKHAEELVAGIEDPAKKVERVFSWVSEEIGRGGGADLDQVLATRRGERTGLLTALLRAAGFDAQIALGEPGVAPLLDHTYPNPAQFNLRFVRIEWPGNRRWARVDTETPWLGLLPPSMRNGHYLLAEAPEKLRPIPVRDDEIERWPLESVVELTIDDNGTAKGKVVMRLPGTFGAELREFVQTARRDEMMRHFQGWIGTVIPGARLLQATASEEPTPAPLVLEAEILVGHFMVRDGSALVAEQLFDAPLALVSLGLPTLDGYLRVPNRQSPLSVVELAERMTVTLRFPSRCAVPIEAPRSFHRGADWGVFHQAFDWDAEEKVATLIMEHSTPQLRLSPADFAAFRESAQEILQASRNRLIVPIQIDSADLAH